MKDYAVHPGEILKEYLDSLGITVIDLAKKTGINESIIKQIIKGKSGITVETAIKLEKAFSFEAQFWINLQTNYNQAIKKEEIKISSIEKRRKRNERL